MLYRDDGLGYVRITLCYDYAAVTFYSRVYTSTWWNQLHCVSIVLQPPIRYWYRTQNYPISGHSAISFLEFWV